MAEKAQRETEVRRARILLVDDHPIVLQGLKQLINQEKDLMVCGEAADSNGALKAFGTLKPDLAIIDISLKQGSGLELIKTLKVRYPKMPVLVLSMHDDSLYAERVLRAGAKGFINKAEATDKLIAAIHKVLNGGIYLSDKIGSKILSKLFNGQPDKDISPMGCLSDRELEVFQLIGQGHATREIAEALHLSVKTIETYRENIKEKLKLKNATELVQHAVHWVENLDST